MTDPSTDPQQPDPAHAPDSDQYHATDPHHGADSQPDPEPAEPEGGNTEAARYRRRLRETESERDTLARRVETLQRAAVERAAAEHLAQPGDLWALGTQLSDLLDGDTGDVDDGKVTAAIDSLLSSRPGLRKVRAPDAAAMGQGRRGEVAGADWQSVFQTR